MGACSFQETATGFLLHAPHQRRNDRLLGKIAREHVALRRCNANERRFRPRDAAVHRDKTRVCGVPGTGYACAEAFHELIGGYVLVRRLIIIAGLLWAVIAATMPASAQVPPGSYLRSCSNIQFDGNTLSAFCVGPGGRSYPSRLAAGSCRGDIANINGRLLCAGGGGAPRPQYGGGPPPQYGGPPPQYDYPPPRQDYGGPPPYRGGGEYGGGFGLPGGSWRRSCGNPVMRGPILFAECQRTDGRIQPSRADIRACRRFANINGQLACE